MANASCPRCGGQTAVAEMSLEEHHLHFENARLRAEIEKISAMAGKYVSKPAMSYPVMSPPIPSRPSQVGLGTFGGAVNGNGGNLLRSVSGAGAVDRPMIINLAVGAMDEFMRMAQVDQPLWMITGRNETDLALNEDEYARVYYKGVGPRLAGSRIEASKGTGVVIMNHVNIAEMLMDVNQWSTMFTGMVSNAMTHEVLSSGVPGNINGTLQLMSAEFHVPSPIVSARESSFVRYCKQQGDGLWAVVDVSVDNLHSNVQNRCRRRPSGCLIQEMSNGCSKVTWVEHVEVDDNGRSNQSFRQVISQALSATRWIATLERKCERLASLIFTNIPSVEMDMITTQGKMGMLNLAERMAINFFDGVSVSNPRTWSTLQGGGTDDVRVMMRKTVADPGRPPGIVLSAATSLWLPVPPRKIFDFLRNENTRSQWDVLSNGGVMKKIANIPNGRDTRNCVSLLQKESSNDNGMVILEEHCTDPTGSFVIYAPVDTSAMRTVLTGGDPDYVALLPSGFSILPDDTAKPAGGAMGDGTGGGSFLTVAFQILVDSLPSSDLTVSSVATANNLIACTLDGITKSLACETA